MLNGKYRSFEHAKFGSIIDRDDGQSIPDYFATNIENWIIRNNSQLEFRNGLDPRGTIPEQTNLGAGVLYKNSTGNKYLVRVINGAGNTSKFQQSTDEGLNWVDITSGGSKTTNAIWVMVQANENLYAVNGVDTPIKFDGTSISTVSAIPQSTCILWYKNRLWAGGNPTYKDRLYYSNPSDPETWGGSDYLNINLGDGSSLVALYGQPGTQSEGRLYVGKERSIWILTGNTSSDFAIQPLTYEHGVCSPEAITQVGKQVWCVDKEGNVRGLYRTTEDTPFSSLVSSDIQTTIASINKASLNKTSSAWFNNFAMFFVPNGVDSHNSLVLVFDVQANENKGGWVKFTGWNIARAVVFDSTEPKLFLFDSRTSNGQAYEWAGTSDNGSAINATYETKIYDHGFPERTKKWKFSYQFAPVLGEVPFLFYSSIDRYYYTLLKTFNLSGNASLWGSMIWGVDKWGSSGQVQQKIYFDEGGGVTKGYTNQIKLFASSSTTKIKVRKFTMHYLVLGLK